MRPSCSPNVLKSHHQGWKTGSAFRKKSTVPKLPAPFDAERLSQNLIRDQM
jgi:hypothetical protein